jgi:uncharacterized membrane protein
MTDTNTIVAIGHFAATAFMCGLIWVVQLVHYPLMRFVDASKWTAFCQAHQTRITLIVAPMMAAEAVLGAAILILGFRSAAAWLGTGLLAVAWISTFLVQIPLHVKLQARFDAALHERLVRTNWLRTIAWTLRVFVASGLLLT